MLSIVAIKGIALGLILLITFICTMMPLKLFRSPGQRSESSTYRYKQLFSLMSSFSGGIFMATCILVLLPDVQDQIHLLFDQNFMVKSYPMAELIIVFGFLLVLSVEQIVLKYKETSLVNRASEFQSRNSEQEERRDTLQQQHIDILITEQHNFNASIRVETGAVSGVNRNDGTAADQREPEGDKKLAFLLSLRSLLLLFVSSLHSIFEGLAIGLQERVDNVVVLFLVVVFHKGIIAFSLGLNMMQSKLTPSQIFIANMFFCVTSPLGVGIGMGITQMQASFTTAAVSGTLQGIACGTFLYLTLFEILPQQLNSDGNRLLKLLFIILGFISMCGFLFLDPAD